MHYIFENILQFIIRVKDFFHSSGDMDTFNISEYSNSVQLYAVYSKCKIMMYSKQDMYNALHII